MQLLSGCYRGFFGVDWRCKKVFFFFTSFYSVFLSHLELGCHNIWSNDIIWLVSFLGYFLVTRPTHKRMKPLLLRETIVIIVLFLVVLYVVCCMLYVVLFLVVLYVICCMWYVRQHGFFYQLSSFRNSMLIWLEPMLKVMRVCARHTFLLRCVWACGAFLLVLCVFAMWCTCTAGILLRQHNVYDEIGAPQASDHLIIHMITRISRVSIVVTLYTDIVVISRSSCMFPHIHVPSFSFHYLTPPQ